jgi:hypothetical protein
MDQDTIQTIAHELAQRLASSAPSFWPIPWQLLLLQTVLVIVAFAAGAIFAERLRMRADPRRDDRSGRSDDDVARELGRPLDGELGEDDWRTREWANLRRVKLEVLLSKMHDCEHFLAESGKSARTQERDPLSELDVITTLYFPELKSEVDGYLDQCRARRSAASAAAGATRELHAVDLKSAREQLSAAAQSLTTRIMGLAA